MEAIKQELTELVLAVIKGLRVLIVYMVPSVLLAMAAVPNLGSVIQETPEVLLPYIINAIALAIITYFQPKVERLEDLKEKG